MYKHTNMRAYAWFNLECCLNGCVGAAVVDPATIAAVHTMMAQDAQKPGDALHVSQVSYIELLSAHLSVLYQCHP